MSHSDTTTHRCTLLKMVSHTAKKQTFQSKIQHFDYHGNNLLKFSGYAQHDVSLEILLNDVDRVKYLRGYLNSLRNAMRY